MANIWIQSPKMQALTAMTPLHLAIWHNQRVEFDIQLYCGADLKAQAVGDLGLVRLTPIELAVRLGHRSMFQILWATEIRWFGSNLSNPFASGKTLVEWAALEGHNEILQDLLALHGNWAPATTLQALRFACREWRVGCAEILLAHYSFNMATLEVVMGQVADHTPVTDIACRPLKLVRFKDVFEQIKILRLLLNTHAQGAGQPPIDQTALLDNLLLRASRSAFDLVTIKFLLERGANINTKDPRTGKTPIHHAAEMRQGTKEGRACRIDFLLRAGAGRYLVDKRNNRAWDLVAPGSASDVEFFLRYV